MGSDTTTCRYQPLCFNGMGLFVSWESMGYTMFGGTLGHIEIESLIFSYYVTRILIGGAGTQSGYRDIPPSSSALSPLQY